MKKRGERRGWVGSRDLCRAGNAEDGLGRAQIPYSRAIEDQGGWVVDSSESTGGDVAVRGADLGDGENVVGCDWSSTERDVDGVLGIGGSDEVDGDLVGRAWGSRSFGT